MRWLGILLAVGLGACFDPAYPENIPCSENDTCPPGQSCDVDGVVRLEPLAQCLDDRDCDGVLDAQDNCPDEKNAEQEDLEADGQGMSVMMTTTAMQYSI
jgi:hypothetical protein